MTEKSAGSGGDGESTALRTDVLLIKPPDMESLWEWFAYTKRTSDCDPSWGRVWPTALSLARWILLSLNDDAKPNYLTSNTLSDKEMLVQKRAVEALRETPDVVELGCGLGLAGLAYASSLLTTGGNGEIEKTITFLDREQYALHCVMSSASANGFKVGPIIPSADRGNNDEGDPNRSSITVRAAVDDWNITPSNNDDDSAECSSSQVKNICYRDLHIRNNGNTIILASDILYEPSSMSTLANKLISLLNPTNGGFALIADPRKERTAGCRDAFVTSVKQLGGTVAVVPTKTRLNDGTKNGCAVGLLDGDIDIDGSVAETVLLVVHFEGKHN